MDSTYTKTYNLYIPRIAQIVAINFFIRSSLNIFIRSYSSPGPVTAETVSKGTKSPHARAIITQ